MRSRSVSCNCMTRTSQQESRGILELSEYGGRNNEKKAFMPCVNAYLCVITWRCASGEDRRQVCRDLITSIKKEDPSSLSSFLEQGISDENETYVLQFPGRAKRFLS